MLGCVSREEVARVPSPDGRVEAVVVETNGGATTSFGYEVQVFERTGYRAAFVASVYGAVRNDNAFGVNLNWASNDELRIEYMEARQARLEHSSVHLGGRDIRIVLQAGIRDPDAPAGGMLDNSEHKRQEAGR